MNRVPLSRLNLTVTFKLLLFVFSIVLLIVGIMTWLSVDNAGRSDRKKTEQNLQELYGDYNDEALLLQRSLLVLASSFADRPDVRELFLAKDRQGLANLLTPILATLKRDASITHLYLHEPDGVVLLRVHDPDRFGDSVTYRRTTVAALDSRQPVAGVEIGSSLLGVRGVAPMVHQGDFIGLVEVGLDYDQVFIEDLKARNRADYKIWVTFDAAAPAGLQPKGAEPPSPSAKFFHYASTNLASLPIPEEVYLSVLQGSQAEVRFVSRGNQESAVLIGPLLGYDDRILGILEISVPRTAALAELQRDRLQTLGVAGGLTLLALALMWFSTNVVVLRPLRHLTAVADRQIKGDRAARVEVLPTDEFGQLGRTLNNLTAELDRALKNQESTIAERTTQLQLTLSIAQRFSSILDFERLLKEVVNLIQNSFKLYHTHIYLLDENNENLMMVEGYGQAGTAMKAAGHHIPLNAAQSLVARAARSGQIIRVDEVRAEPNWLSNPLLPETRSEMAVPIKLGKQVVGVLDLQSDQEAGFSEQDLITMSAVSEQIAVAVRNARRFAETTQALAEAEKLQQLYTQTSWQAYLPKRKTTTYQQIRPGAAPLDDNLLNQVKQRLTQGQTVVLTPSPGEGNNEDNQPTLAAPLAIRGQIIGHIRVHDTDKPRQWTADEIALIEAISEQMSVAIENARLFDETQQRAVREQLAREITDKMRASPDVDSIIQIGLTELAKALGVSRTYIKLTSVSQPSEQESE